MQKLKLLLCGLMIYALLPGMVSAKQCFVIRVQGFNQLQAVTRVNNFMADFSGDGRIDFDDFFLFSDFFGRDIGEKDERERFDFNGDGKIFWEDFFSFADAFGRLVPPELKDRVAHLTPDQISIGTYDTTKISPTPKAIFAQLRASRSAGYYYSARSLQDAKQPFVTVFITVSGDSTINTLKDKWSVSGPDKGGLYKADLPFGVIADLSLNRDIIKLEDAYDRPDILR